MWFPGSDGSIRLSHTWRPEIQSGNDAVLLERPFIRRGPLRRLAQYAVLRGSHQTKATTRNCSPTGYLKMVSTAFGTAWLTATMLKF
jgi:hypothetical protein